MGVHIHHLLGIVPSTLKPLYLDTLLVSSTTNDPLANHRWCLEDNPVDSVLGLELVGSSHEMRPLESSGLPATSGM